MILPWKFLVVLLLIGLSAKNTFGDEEAPAAAGEDDEVGSPLLALKGIKKLKLLGAVKKIKLKLAGLGLKKGLLLSKIPLLGAANPFAADGEEQMDGTDSYYIGTPEDVGAHMWGSQQFDRNLHPENSHYQMDDEVNRSWMHHQEPHYAPQVGSEHDAEHLPGYFEPHRGPEPEIYRAPREGPHPMSYQPPTYHPGHSDSFEFEGQQESRYEATKTRSSNDGLYGEMERVEADRTGPATAPRNTEVQRFAHTPQIAQQDEEPVQGSSQAYYAEPKQQAQYVHQPGGVQSGVLEWSSMKNLRDLQPQVVEWPGTAHNEVVAAENPHTDNMSHIQGEDEHGNPVIMQGYVQAVKGTGHENLAPNTQKYYKNKLRQEVQEGTVFTENESNFRKTFIGPYSEVESEHVQRAQQEQTSVLQYTGRRQNGRNEPVTFKVLDRANLDPVSRNANEVKRDNERSKLDVPSRRSVEGGGNGPDTAQHQIVGYSNWGNSDFSETMPQAEQSFTQGFQRGAPEQPKNPVRMVTQGQIADFDGARAETNNQFYAVDRAGEPQSPFVVNSPMQSAAFSYGAQSPQYQQNSGAPRLVNEEKPDIVEDTNPISAVILPPDTHTVPSGMPEPVGARANYAMQYTPDQQSQVLQEPPTQSKYQQPVVDAQAARIMTPEQNPPGPGYVMQYAAPEHDPRPQYRVPQGDPSSFGYSFDQTQYRGSVEGDQQFAPMAQGGQAGIADSQQYRGSVEGNQQYSPMIQGQQVEMADRQQYRGSDEGNQRYAPAHISPGGQTEMVDEQQYRSPAEGNQQYAPMTQGGQAQMPDEHQIGTMGPQIPEHARSFHKKFLFGLKKGYNKGGYDYGGGYNNHNNYGGGYYNQNNYGGGHGYSSNYYGHSYGYVGQPNPSEAPKPQEGTPVQYMQAAGGSPGSNTDLEASGSSNDHPDTVEAQASTCSCSRAWPEAPPEYNDDKRLDNSSHSVRSKRNVDSPDYFSTHSDYYHGPFRKSERFLESPPRRHFLDTDNKQSTKQFAARQTQKPYPSYPPYSNVESVVEPYHDTSYFNSAPQPDYFLGGQQNVKEVTLNDPSKVDADIYKTIMEHTEQSIRDALAKASADPVQIGGGQIVLNEEDLKNGGPVHESPMYEGNPPIINLPSDQSSLSSMPMQAPEEAMKNFQPEILPAPSEKSITSYRPQGSNDYQFQDNYPKSFGHSSYPPARDSDRLNRPDFPKKQIDPLEALKMFDMASTSGSSFHQLLDAIKSKLFACCEKCKDKILKGIHEKIDEEENGTVSDGESSVGDASCEIPLPSALLPKSALSNYQPARDIYKEIETLSHDIWNEEHGRRGSKTLNRKALSEKKMRLKKLVQFLAEVKCRCNSEECSVEGTGSGEHMFSNEQSSLEMSFLRKPSRRTKGHRDGNSSRSKKNRNSSHRRSSRKSSRRKSKPSADKRERSSIS